MRPESSDLDFCQRTFANILPVVANLHDRLAGQCVYCHHCLPCPESIEVGWMLWIVDHARDSEAVELFETG